MLVIQSPMKTLLTERKKHLNLFLANEIWILADILNLILRRNIDCLYLKRIINLFLKLWRQRNLFGLTVYIKKEKEVKMTLFSNFFFVGKMMTSWRQDTWKGLNIWTSWKEIWEGIPWQSSVWDSAFSLPRSQHSVPGWDRSCKLHDLAKKE